MERLGLSYTALREHNPKIIYASASGYGQTGPYRLKAGQDLLAQAVAGITWLTGEPDGPPVPSGAIVADYTCGMLLAQGILAALLARERTGVSQEVSISLLDTVLALQSEYVTAHLTSGFSGRSNTRPLNRVYRTKDDKWIALAGSFGAEPVRQVCEALGLSQLADDERFATWEKANYEHGPELTVLFADAFRTKIRKVWLRLLEHNDILCAPVNRYTDVFADPQVRHNNVVVEFDHPRAGKVRTVGMPIKFSETPAKIRLPPPMLGQHTQEILDMLGYTDAQIDQLRAHGVVA
jgi:formyl-CoA transferase